MRGSNPSYHTTQAIYSLKSKLLSLCSSTDCSYCSCDIIVLIVAIVPSHCNKKQEVIKRAHAKILPHARV